MDKDENVGDMSGANDNLGFDPAGQPPSPQIKSEEVESVPAVPIPNTTDTPVVGTVEANPQNKIERLEIEPRTENIDIAPKPAMMEETMIGAELEPTTEAASSEQAPTATSSVVTDPAAQPGAQVAVQPTVMPPVESPAPVKQNSKSRFLMMVVAGVLLLGLLGGAAWWFLVGAKANNSASMSTEQPKLGIAITVADGTVEYKRGEMEWLAADAETKLQEGDMVRTGTESRAVLTFDDGSAVRLDASTVVELESLSTDDVIIKQIEGTIYSRVVPSDRGYTVAIEDTTYRALGTAFVTINTEDEKGIQVYQSSVKASDSVDTITEGNQYFKKNDDATLQGKVTAIDVDGLVDSSFVNWNLSQDETDTNFREKLGVLSEVKQRNETLEQERQAEKAKEVQAEKAVEEMKHHEHMEGKVTRGAMVLSVSNKTFSWNYTGKAVHGYQLVYSKKNPTPTFGTNDAVFFEDMDETSGKLSDEDKIRSGKYYVRICAYTADTESEPCVDYSNIVIFQL